MGAALVLITEALLIRLTSQIKDMPAYTIEMLYDEKTALDQVLRFCKDSSMEITNLKIHSLGDAFEADYAAEVTLRGSRSAKTIVPRIQVMPGVVSAIDIEK